uniref:Toll7 n=1 Tax=Sinohyriopsis cumingii TaxID=165450 RepID=A0A5B7QC93_SINCU|nr:Toll7 [Sinohyriopsis cumingii]
MTVPCYNFEAGLTHSVCILIFVSAILTFSEADVPCPDPICKCKNRTATCNGNISYIPPLPSLIRFLIFDNNYLPSISRNTFSNITNLKLGKIQLSMCEIQTITSDAFYNFNLTLTELNLSGNTRISKEHLSSSFRLVRIHRLYLNQINMGYHIYLNFFEGMEKSPLREIQLRANNFQNITDTALKILTHLKQLDLSNNRIVFAELFGLAHLQTLKLSFNRLSEVPDFCANGTSKFPQIRSLYLDNNAIEALFKASLSCLTYLRWLHLEKNRLVSLNDNVFSQLGRLDDLFLNEMKLKNISSFAFNNSNLKTLSLSKCEIKFTSDNFDYANLFRWSPNLQRLQLDWNNMHKTNASSLVSMLSPLNKLRDLNLESSKLKTLPAEVFKPLVSLRHLDLTLNSISEWPITLFSNVSKLSKLLMAGNKIQVIKEGYLPSSLMEHLTTLDLSENPFDCSCENLWFRKWMDNILRQKPHIFSKYPDHYRCATPSRLQGTLLMDYNPTDEDCRPWGRVLMDIIITSGAVCLVFACVAVVYIQRWNIRYLLHNISMRRKKYTVLTDADFQYDLYVAYSDKDASWVRNELWRELGQERGLKLYIRDKSEDPGVAKCDSIINNMYESRKVLLVISSNFMSCPWCLYQLQVAQGRAVHTGPNWMIPVTLGDLPIRHVTKSIRVLLTQENVISWSEEENGKRLFWSTILRSIETSVNLNDVIEGN